VRGPVVLDASAEPGATVLVDEGAVAQPVRFSVLAGEPRGPDGRASSGGRVSLLAGSMPEL
jgi:hypothetical protein